jgi:uncharacterized protein (TIGR02145 family)
MRIHLYYLRFVTCTLFILLVISILNIQAQDYLISFEGAGASTTVTMVKVENLTQGTSIEMKGSDVLHLMGVITGIETIKDDETGNIGFYPNPMKDYSRMLFVLLESGETIITLYDLSGRKIVQTRDLLSKGQHTYGIQGIKEGIYFTMVSSGRYSFSGRLIASGSQKGIAKIVYENTQAAKEKQSDSKGTNEETVMQYTIGDRLLLTGISGIHSTVVTDVPTANKTITFNFIACTDGDGNNYPVVQIGAAKGTIDNLDPSGGKSLQNWMGENLRTTKLRDGAIIPQVTENEVWGNLSTPAYCWYENNVGNKNVYGAIYNWYAVNTGKLCPDGWHVPVNSDWDALTTYLGGFSIAGGKLKETGLTHWINPNSWATNETGFTALPGGVRVNNGVYDRIGYAGDWWSATESSSTYAWGYFMGYFDRDVRSGISMKRSGNSIRCIND